MLFNSLDFAIFLPLVFTLYWLIPAVKFKSQNGLLLVASYIFYGWWDPRFLILIFFSSLVDFHIGKQLPKYTSAIKRKLLLTLSISVNIGLLGFFKYYNFFIESFTDSFSFFGVNIEPTYLNIILPVGISFYTFQTLSYTIDVYRKSFKPVHDSIAFFTFVSFFPQLVAGPIERAKNLIPQFEKIRLFDFNLALSGVSQITWGLFKKIVIADTCKNYADVIFNNHSDYSSLTLALGAIYFGFQIYCDFSGYSDIAIGSAKLFGFNFKANFRFPYFSRDIAEFWRRWHISLSTWFRDYLYIPLGGSQTSSAKKIRNIFIIFLVSGFWHGADTTFIVWGALNAIYFLPLNLLHLNRRYVDDICPNNILPGLKEASHILLTFTLTTFAWIFFRAENMQHALNYCSGLLKFKMKIDYLSIERYAFEAIPLILLLLIIEWPSRNKAFPLEYKGGKVPLHLLKVLFIFGLILLLGAFSKNQEFIYFQF